MVIRTGIYRRNEVGTTKQDYFTDMENRFYPRQISLSANPVVRNVYKDIFIPIFGV